jgi:hypothetical protein
MLELFHQGEQEVHLVMVEEPINKIGQVEA